jgi:hypothetical protein
MIVGLGFAQASLFLLLALFAPFLSCTAIIDQRVLQTLNIVQVEAIFALP